MTSLDARIKGSLPSGFPADVHGNALFTPLSRTPKTPTNPLDNAPSSPQQIYLNLLILEASLRSQYLTLSLRRRKYTFFLTLLIAWTAYFSYILFFIGPSPYYYVYLLQKLAFMGGAVTLGLFYLSGLYRKTMVFPRKFVGNTNKGLRQFNIKLVAVKLTFWERVQGWLLIFPFFAWLFPYASSLPPLPPPPLSSTSCGSSHSSSIKSSFSILFGGQHAAPPPPSPNPTPRKRRASHLQSPPNLSLLPGSGSSTPLSSSVPASRRGTPPPITDHEEEFDSLQPSGSHVKLVILPKGFSPDFREGWELYRTEYWEKENERRTLARAAQRRGRKGRSGQGDDKHERLYHSRSSSRSSTPEPGSQAETTETPRRPRHGSGSSIVVKRRAPVASGSTSSVSTIGSLERERGGSLTPGSQLRSEYLPDVKSVDNSDSGSVRSIMGTGSAREDGGVAGGEKKTKGGRRGKGKSRGSGGNSRKKDVSGDAKNAGKEVSGGGGG